MLRVSEQKSGVFQCDGRVTATCVCIFECILLSERIPNLEDVCELVGFDRELAKCDRRALAW